MIKPLNLTNDKKIGIFSTSSPVTDPEMLDKLKEFFNQKGFEVYIHPQVSKVVGHTAGTIEDRVNAIHEMVQDKSIGMLMAFWGGANTNQVLPYLDYELIRQHPKIFVGFSDTSALTLAITKKTGLITFMGPAGVTFTKPDFFGYSWDYFEKTFINPENEIIIDDSKDFADDLFFLRNDNKRIIQPNVGRKVFKPGSAEGEVVSANLQTLLVLHGTEFFPDLEDKILFIEEAEEENTKMTHRFFTHLAQSVNLSKLKGILIGRFCSDSGFNDQDSVEAMFEDVFSKLDIPIIYNLDFGHSDPMFTIPNGGKVVINTDNNLLKFDNSVV